MSLPSSSSLSSKKGVEGKHQTISLFPIANFLIHSNDTPAHDERRGASAGEKGDIDIYIYIYEYMCVCVCVFQVYTFLPPSLPTRFIPWKDWKGRERTGKGRKCRKERTGKGQEKGRSAVSLFYMVSPIIP